MDRYEIVRDIDEGAFGVVQMGRNRESGDLVAIKRIKRKFHSWDECISLREVKSLRKLKHPNIVKLKEVFKEENELFLVFECCERNLFRMYTDEYRNKGISMPEGSIREIVRQAASGLAYMHRNGFFHRDLKPENLLLTSGGEVKIADFGLAREIRSSPPFTDYVATRWYRAPEILLKSPNYNSPVDIFALGCIMAELYLGQPLFNGSSELDQLNKICAVIGSPSRAWAEGHRLAAALGFTFPQYSAQPLESLLKAASPQAVDLIRMMLNFDSAKRPSAAKVLAHPFLADLPKLDNLFPAQSCPDSYAAPQKLIPTNIFAGEETPFSPRKAPVKLDKENEKMSPPLSTTLQDFSDAFLDISTKRADPPSTALAFVSSAQPHPTKPDPQTPPPPSHNLIARALNSAKKVVDPLFDDQLEELLKDTSLFPSFKAPDSDKKEKVLRDYPLIPDHLADSDIMNSGPFKGPSYLIGIDKNLRFGYSKP